MSRYDLFLALYVYLFSNAGHTTPTEAQLKAAQQLARQASYRIGETRP